MKRFSGIHQWPLHYSFRPPWGVSEANIHQTYKPCFCNTDSYIDPIQSTLFFNLFCHRFIIHDIFSSLADSPWSLIFPCISNFVILNFRTCISNNTLDSSILDFNASPSPSPDGVISLLLGSCKNYGTADLLISSISIVVLSIIRETVVNFIRGAPSQTWEYETYEGVGRDNIICS